MGQLHADRDGEVLDLQVIAGQTMAVGQRLGTIGRVAGGGASLKALSYFAPADARRLRNGIPVEVVPHWNQRSRFGGIVGKVLQVNTLPATEEDISTTIGNPQTGTGSLCTVRPDTDGSEPEGRREPWREQRRTPEGSAPPIKGSPPPISTHQRRSPTKVASLAPTLGAARTMEGPAAAAPIQSSARAGAQSVQSDSRATQVTGARLAW